MITEFNPRLVEAAVQESALQPGPWTARYHRERAKAYDIADAEERERAFQRLHSQWFGELELGRAVRQALADRPRIARSIGRTSVAPAPRARDEGAEMFVRAAKPDRQAAERRRLTILLRPASLLRPAAVTALLRRELLHVDDMLDPAFGYEPELPRSLAGPTRDRLLLDRYAAAWSASVAGRLHRERALSAAARTAALVAFVRPFSILGSDAPAAFERLFDAPRPTHAQLVELVLEPLAGTSGSRSEALAEPAQPRPRHASGQRCALCAMPTAEITPASGFRPDVIDAVRTDFADWRPDDGACPQCTELYDSRVRARRR